MKKSKFMGILSAAVITAVTASAAAMNAFAEGEAAASNPQQGGGGVFMTLILPLIIMFGLLYFIAIKPQKKREKELKEMQESLQVGDEIVTGGGIVGFIVSVGEDTVVIETGGAKHKLRIKNWAITENVTALERMKSAKAAASNKKAKDSGLESAAVVDDTDKKSKKKKNEE